MLVLSPGALGVTPPTPLSACEAAIYQGRAAQSWSSPVQADARDASNASESGEALASEAESNCEKGRTGVMEAGNR